MNIILIIGGSGSTIGHKLIGTLSRSDDKIITTYHTSSDTAMLQQVTDSYAMDIRSEESVKQVIKDVVNRHRRLDILINNAGITRDTLAPVMKSTDWNEVIATNLTGVFFSCKYASRVMIAQRSGKIINIASYKGMAGGVGQANYSASKAGVIALTKSMARELAPFRVVVNAVCPGFVPSRLNAGQARKQRKAVEESLLGIEHNLDDLANFVAFLCTDQLRGVTGQIFCIDSRLP